MKRRAAQISVIFAAIPALIFSASGVSFADSNNVSWKNVGTTRCLTWDTNYITGAVDWLGTEDCSNHRGSTRWRDVSVGANRWQEKPAATNISGNWVDVCLTAYWSSNGASVYLEGCSPNNTWQQWEENWTGSAWRLKHVQTGLFLDSNSSGSVYALSQNTGNNQLWQ